MEAKKIINNKKDRVRYYRLCQGCVEESDLLKKGLRLFSFLGLGYGLFFEENDLMKKGLGHLFNRQFAHLASIGEEDLMNKGLNDGGNVGEDDLLKKGLRLEDGHHAHQVGLVVGGNDLIKKGLRIICGLCAFGDGVK
jgi:hypothetical protein